MDDSRLQNIKILPFRWVSLLFAVALAVGTVSFVNETRTAQAAVEKYVGIWEDDIARAKIFQGDPSLQNKILKQLNEVHSSVAATEVQNPEKLNCLLENQVPITYNSLPVGAMKVCYSAADLGLKALTSPLMMLGFLLGMLFLALGLKREYDNRLQEQKLKSELALNQEIAGISRQVAHDIRGPLMALTTLSKLSHEMSSDKKELLQLAVSRIRGIAEDLLQKGKTPVMTGAINAGASTRAQDGVELIPLTEALLKEYRFSHPAVQFQWHNHLADPLASSGVNVALGELKIQRIISNLLNNALEASSETEASINVTLMERSDHFLLQIMDNGCGIPEEVLPKLMAEGFSYGKTNGHGLGLYDARKTLQSIGGDLQIRSRDGIGTQVILLFPKHRLESATSQQEVI